jgi:hypothetical protein
MSRVKRAVGKVRRSTSEPHHTFESGAVRSERLKARYDLIPGQALKRLALRYALGAEKYGEWNWANGLPVDDLLNHVIEHLMKARDKFVAMQAARDIAKITNTQPVDITMDLDPDDDLAGAAWGCFTLIEMEERMKKNG